MPTSPPDAAARLRRRGRWERRTGPALTVAALVFLAGYALPIIWPELPAGVQAACRWTMNAAWALFGIDFAVRFSLARERAAFLRRHVFDLAVVALPLIRPLALLKVIAAISVLKRAGVGTLRGRVVTFATGGTALLVVVAGLAITDAERGQPGATIAGFADGVWWAIATITTVGYGDRYPVTGMGRVIAAGLMIAGIALLGLVTATLASWFVQRIADDEAEQQAATRAEMDELVREVRALREALAETRGLGSGP